MLIIHPLVLIINFLGCILLEFILIIINLFKYLRNPSYNFKSLFIHFIINFGIIKYFLHNLKFFNHFILFELKEYLIIFIVH